MDENTIHVGNLCSSIDEFELKEIFSNVGKILNAKLMGDAWLDKRYAFIEFESKESSLAAVKMSGRLIGKFPVKVSMAKKRIKSPMQVRVSKKDDPRLKRTIHVAQIDWEVDEGTILNIFEQFGYITNYHVVQNRLRPSFAFFEYASEESARFALEQSGVQLGKCILKVSFSKSPILCTDNLRNFENSKTLLIMFLRNNSVPKTQHQKPLGTKNPHMQPYLSSSMEHIPTSETIEEIFSKCGTIEKIDVIPSYNCSPVTALVDFERPEALANALKMESPRWKNYLLSLSPSRYNIKEHKRKMQRVPYIPNHMQTTPMFIQAYPPTVFQMPQYYSYPQSFYTKPYLLQPYFNPHTYPPIFPHQNPSPPRDIVQPYLKTAESIPSKRKRSQESSIIKRRKVPSSDHV